MRDKGTGRLEMMSQDAPSLDLQLLPQKLEIAPEALVWEEQRENRL